MRFRALTLAAAAAALALPLSGTSSAMETCKAIATSPHITKNGAITGLGGFACKDAAYGMSVKVCIQEQLGGIAGTAWFTMSCATSPFPVGATQLVTQSVTITDVPVSSVFLRTTATGTNANNQTAYAESAPYFWFNCACMP